MAPILPHRWSQLTHPLCAPRPSIITGNESEQSNWLHSLTFFSSPLPEPSIWHRVPMFMHLLRLLAGLSEKKEGLFFFFFSPFLFFFLLCNLLPSETINAHSTSTSRHGFDVYSGSGPLSFSAACCSLCLPSSPPPRPPFLSLPLPLTQLFTVTVQSNN